MVIEKDIIIELLGENKQEKERFEQVLIESFVDDNPSIKWCPSPGCKNAILLLEISMDKNEAVECECGFEFCFRCGNPSHQPSSCEMIKTWKTKYSGNPVLCHVATTTASLPHNNNAKLPKPNIIKKVRPARVTSPFSGINVLMINCAQNKTFIPINDGYVPDINKIIENDMKKKCIRGGENAEAV